MLIGEAGGEAGLSYLLLGEIVMPMYRKKPVVIEARQYAKDNVEELLDWIIENGHEATFHGAFQIHTLEGVHRADVGDYIVKGIKGEFYPCKPDIFEASNEPIGTP